MEKLEAERLARGQRAWVFAQKAAAEGFGTKAEKKEALEAISRAWEYWVAEVVHQKLLAVTHEERGEAWRELYYGFPAAHVWKEKHAVKFAAYPEEVKRAGEVAAFRAQVAAMEVVKKEKKKTVAQLKKEAEAKQCQICARPIFAEVGVIAHHGYERPGWGYQTASCWGARHLPYEVSREELGRHIELLKERMAEMVKAKRAVQFEEVPLFLGYSVPVPNKEQWAKQEYVKVVFEMVRATTVEKLGLHKNKGFGWNEPGIKIPYGLEEGEWFEHYKAKELAERAGKIKQLKEYIVWQEGRYAAWKQLLEWKGKKWVKV